MTRDPVMTADQLSAVLRAAFPDLPVEERSRVVEVAPGRAVMALLPGARHLRLGGVIGGPTQMSLADVAMYAVVLAHLGDVAMAVTTSLTMHFLAPAPAAELFAEARLLRLGRRLATGDISLWSEGRERPCAHDVVAYAIPLAAAEQPAQSPTDGSGAQVARRPN